MVWWFGGWAFWWFGGLVVQGWFSIPLQEPGPRKPGIILRQAQTLQLWVSVLLEGTLVAAGAFHPGKPTKHSQPLVV